MILVLPYYDLVDSLCNWADPRGVAADDPNVSGVYNIMIIYDPPDHVSIVLTLPKKFGRSSALVLQRLRFADSEYSRKMWNMGGFSSSA